MLKLRRSWVLLLWAVAILSLALNVFLLVSLVQFRDRARREVATAAAVLRRIEVENFELPVQIDETLTLSLTVPFSDTFAVPISATVPVSTSVPFQDNIDVPVNSVIPVNTRVSVPVPVLGNIVIPIPIVTNIPVNLNIAVPISRTIPVQIDIPVDLMVDVPVQSDIPVEAEVPVQLEFPVVVPLAEMGLTEIFDQIEEALAGLARIFSPAPAAGDLPAAGLQPAP